MATSKYPSHGATYQNSKKSWRTISWGRSRARPEFCKDDLPPTSLTSTHQRYGESWCDFGPWEHSFIVLVDSVRGRSQVVGQRVVRDLTAPWRHDWLFHSRYLIMHCPLWLYKSKQAGSVSKPNFSSFVCHGMYPHSVSLSWWEQLFPPWEHGGNNWLRARWCGFGWCLTNREQCLSWFSHAMSIHTCTHTRLRNTCRLR